MERGGEGEPSARVWKESEKGKRGEREVIKGGTVLHRQDT